MSFQGTVLYEDFLEICKKKAKYGRYIDMKLWDKMGEIAQPDARFQFCNPDKTVIARFGRALDFASLDDFVGWFREYFEGTQTLHMFGPPDMSMLPDGTVSVTWSMEDQICFEKNDEMSELRGGGYYSEIWVRVAGSWRLQDLVLTRTYTKVKRKSQHSL